MVTSQHHRVTETSVFVHLLSLICQLMPKITTFLRRKILPVVSYSDKKTLLNTDLNPEQLAYFNRHLGLDNVGSRLDQTL